MLESPLHEHHLLRYEVEIVDRPLLSYSKTAVISFFDENNKRVSIFKFGVISNEEIFERIDKGEALSLNNAYIKDLSLTDYRVSKGLDDHVHIKLINFSAKKTFFDCDVSTDLSYALFEGNKTVFESAIFGNGAVSFFNCDFGNGDVNFKKAKFGSGNTSFKSVKFGDGLINFNTTNFGTGNLSFVDVNFGNGNVDFKSTYFGDGIVDFKFAKFSEGDISFERASLGKGKKDFKNVEFGGGKIDFRRIDFNDGDVSFEGVEFGDGKVNFRSSVFGAGHKSFEHCDFAQGEVHFDLVDFGTGSVSFKDAKTTEILFNGCPLNCYMDLRFAECQMLDLSDTIVRDILHVKPEDENVVIQGMKLVNMRILGRVFIDWHANNVYNLINNQSLTSLYQKAEQYRILKENFRNNGQYDDEDASYVEFKRCESKAKLEEALAKDKKNAVWAYPTYYFQKYVFDYIGRYATAPTRVLANVFVTVFAYGIIYYLITEFIPKLGSIASTLPPELNNQHEFWNFIYYSCITFFTIGYGEYFPEGYLKIFAALEGFTGVFLMSYFTVAFVRKILR